VNTWISMCVFALGASIGSFLNATAYRLPRNLSLIHSRSRCSRCSTVIPWYYNIPVLSVILLRGRCRFCLVAYGWYHLLIELLLGYVALTVFRRFGVSSSGLVFFAMFSLCVAISLIDLEFKIIPDSLSLGGLIAALSIAGLFSLSQVPWWVGFQQALMGAMLGAGSL